MNNMTLLQVVLMFNLCPQTLKYSSKSHPGGDHRHEKMRDSSDVTPPCKMLRRSDSPENKHIDSMGHARAKAVHTHRARERDGGETLWFRLRVHGLGQSLLRMNDDT